MIEIKREKDPFGDDYPVMRIDDIPASERTNILRIPSRSTREDAFSVSVFGGMTVKLLEAQRSADIPDNIVGLYLYTHYSLIQDEPEITTNVTFYQDILGGFYIALQLSFDGDNWKRLWSIAEYKEEFTRIFEEQALPDIFITPQDIKDNLIDTFSGDISISIQIQKGDVTIEAETRKHAKTLQLIHGLTEASLSEKLLSDAVVMHFAFPDEVKEACEQYLIYFVRFLKDLGVEATADLQHDAGQVLFAVTPKNKEEALDKIRTALETYLHLAASPVNNFPDFNQEIAIQRLTGEIQSLHSRLSLARAEIQYKDKSIEAQQFIIDQQRLLSGEVMMDSIKNVTPKPKDKDSEEVLDGLAEITKYEGKGFNLNLPEAYRRLKELFSKKE